MRCEFEDRLTAAELGELSGPEAAALEAHVAGCDHCTAARRVDQLLAERLHTEFATPAPQGVHQAVRAALVTEARRLPNTQPAAVPAAPVRRRRRWWLVAAPVAAALAIVVAAALLLGRSDRLLPPPTNVPPPLAAAWSAYGTDALPVSPDGGGVTGAQRTAVLGQAPAMPDAGRRDLHAVGWGALNLAGKPSIAAEYRSSGGQRLTVFRWRGKLTDAVQRDRATKPAAIQGTPWGPSLSAQWNTPDGRVVCVVGNLPQASFNRVVKDLHQVA
jgi:anti-sigma factor RsiW